MSVLTALTLVAPAPMAVAETTPAPSPRQTQNGPAEIPAAVRPEARDKTLGAQWSESKDLAWTTSGDATGFHLLVARSSEGYRWHAVASLSEPGFDTDMWIGNACVTGSGTRAVVIYAPRTFTNRPDLFDRGGFTAVVDLTTGKVTKLAGLSTLAYFNPGCGAAETAVVTQLSGQADERGNSPAKTRLTTIDAARATARKPVEAAGELTSALPVPGGVVAATAGRLVSVSAKGAIATVAKTAGVPFHLAADATGAVVYAERSGAESVRVQRLTPGKDQAATTLATGELGKVGVGRGAAGRVFLTGAPATVGSLPPTVTRLAAPAQATVSTLGRLVVTGTAWAGAADPRLVQPDPDTPRAVTIKATSTVTGQAATFGVAPGRPSAQALTPHPALGGQQAPDGARSKTLAATSDPVDQDGWCSVPRNNRVFQVLQPKPRQVEWAVNQAVTGSLNVQRPANWMNLGMGAYKPQEMFPSIPLAGGGRVHSQVMLGIAAQESNMWQASRLALPGVTGNPLIGNFYGLDIYNDAPGDDWDIQWDKADCGYGVMQVTDGMRKAGHEKPGEIPKTLAQQQAIAADFTANIAAGLRILQEKWNQTRTAGMVIGNGDPAGLENWFFALWAYNTGFYPNQGNGSPWGVGWANNPINPRYPADRYPFMEVTYEDAAHPQRWPYQEKVIGFAGHPPELAESAGKDQTTTVAGFRPAWWTNPAYRLSAKPPIDTFCTAANTCDPNGRYRPNDPGDPDDPDDGTIGELPGPCAHQNANGKYDLKCWWNQAVSWKSDSNTTGRELLRFDPGYAYQDNANSFPPKCELSGLPAGSLVVDDVPAGLPQMRPCGYGFFTEAGTFTFDFPQDETGHYRAKIDLHQLGAGFNSHFWFTHTTRTATDMTGTMKITGTWNFNRQVNGWGRVYVHIPDHGAHTQQANYEIDTGAGFDPARHRVIAQRIRSNTWVPLGAFEFSGMPKVRLSSTTRDGTGDEDIAWDAVAIEPLPGKPRHQIVALGDSYASGEGASEDADADYYPETDFKLVTGDTDAYQNACHRSRHSWSRLASVSGSTASIGERADTRDPAMDYHLLACSGARTHNLLPYHSVPTGAPKPVNAFGKGGSERQFGELSQLDRGFLDANTTLVTLSIGGNDAGFADILQHCLAEGNGVHPCQDFAMEGDAEPLSTASPARITGPVKDSIRTVLQQIRERAPNAWILLMGYPKLFNEDDTNVCVVVEGRGIDVPEEQWLAEQAELLNLTMADLAREFGQVVKFANPIDAFEGRGVCGSPELIHGVIVDKTRGESSDSAVSQQSFHPNILGAEKFAEIMTSRRL
ncbi:GDSL-type esterase/lipase family protein [Nonomuraea zeae]|uniref:Uncharacterized protein n=1 Tax=Nonomuraea zeae TaxID=1642303 RepID=A0A5S4G067_9ACTN|nr:GDSL-type esterase/lipase family protein [Nonomuraea zeae]TMR25914.1 hypothetical protein ETD85_44255 [Nonomuraea zeae]